VTIAIPERLVSACGTSRERRDWLTRLPAVVESLRKDWSLQLAPPFDTPDVSAAWVAPALREDGTHAVLKVGMPHMEAESEIEGLRFWAGEPTVCLLEENEQYGAMLLERCEPGTALRCESESRQDVVVCELMRRLWRTPSNPYSFRSLQVMTSYWIEETRRASARWPDEGLVRAGLNLLQQLSSPKPDDVLLATDLHAGNILAAEREPWLVIDPKPFIGDRAYDATQHLLNCKSRLLGAPKQTVARVAEQVELDTERVRLWLFARLAAEPRDTWDDASIQLARMLS
jgi:streptomycin 6-kinase